jgi:DNA-binding HxlR family transcriptional regulator
MADPGGSAPFGAPGEPDADALGEAVERVGDRWSLLLVAALLPGPRRFNDLQATCGIAPNILSRRLKHLEQATVVTARPYSQRPLRHVYELTPAGRELAAALRLLAAWGQRQAGARPRHSVCGTPVELRWYCPHCAETISERE